jgi:hypothetical protein
MTDGDDELLNVEDTDWFKCVKAAIIQARC